MDKHDYLKNDLLNGVYDTAFKSLYSTDEAVLLQRARYAGLLDDFANHYGAQENIRFFSAPGRSEICGNHTDHNCGKVLAAAINLDIVGAAVKTSGSIVRVKSKKYTNMDIIDLSILESVECEIEHSASLIRGICSRFKALGYKIGGFDMYTLSDVLRGSGLSSSAAFEVLVATAMNHLYNDGKIDAVEIAKIAQFAENVFYKKPCGLMDQTASSVGGFVEIDFENTAKPLITPVNFDFASCGYSLCIVDTGANHADFSDDYAAIRTQMNAVAGELGGSVLRTVNEDDFYNSINNIRKKHGERAVLRSMHFFEENKRVERAVAALRSGNFEAFKANIIESGYSSYMYNQNIYTDRTPLCQPVALALAISERLLRAKGAWRVHGGGFAGTIQAFVPNDLLDSYKTAIEAVFGSKACYVLRVRAVGGCEVTGNR